ncbi:MULTISPECIES: hypothetical protein [unclassified Amycolatopsis]|uniref:hypothetical protein n=1 Tax=unclassified Amycolatopsis TaxID=2618356 RepID=UPI002E160180|nr:MULTISPECIES: hypothetical protein [unclassified Amycolatopsis]WSJ76422.1 hypothetical protein OG439_44760 [Amycolatopsis sp. NBC_01307]WSK79971.1 hypothetical protein OG570_05135 [Amycolatopsis sp. NBC_01286]
MPIRTNRGRAAVYRRLWGFPLRSPRHLIGTLVFLAILVTALGIVVPKVMGKQPAKASPLASGTTTTSVTATQPGVAASVPTSNLPTRLSQPLVTPTTAAPNGDAVRVAKEWAAAWVNHPAGITSAQWLEQLKPFTTEEYLPVMSSVDPANVPATKVTGEPTVGTSYTSSVQLTIPTDGPKLSITVVSTNAGWRVADYDQAS